MASDPSHALRVLVVDDERLARLRLEDLLRREPDVEIVGFSRHGTAAVTAIRELRPDLVFLDVQMPGMSGFDVIRAVGAASMPATIFVTAFERHAVQAFDVAAVDYLVKPFADERFAEAFRRARHRLSLDGIERHRAQLLKALTWPEPRRLASDPALDAAVEPPPASPSVRRPYAERFAVEMHGKVRAVAVPEIDYITASGSYADLHVGERTFAIRETMHALESRLDPAAFLRVHRSVIVRLELVELLHRSAGGLYAVQLRNGIRLPVSRSRYEALERWLGLAS